MICARGRKLRHCVKLKFFWSAPTRARERCDFPWCSGLRSQIVQRYDPCDLLLTCKNRQATHASLPKAMFSLLDLFVLEAANNFGTHVVAHGRGFGVMPVGRGL